MFNGINSVTLRTTDVMVLLHYYKMWNKSNLNVINQMKHLLLDVRYSTLTIFFSFVYYSRTEMKTGNISSLTSLARIE